MPRGTGNRQSIDSLLTLTGKGAFFALVILLLLTSRLTPCSAHNCVRVALLKGSCLIALLCQTCSTVWLYCFLSRLLLLRGALSVSQVQLPGCSARKDAGRRQDPQHVDRQGQRLEAVHDAHTCVHHHGPQAAQSQEHGLRPRREALTTQQRDSQQSSDPGKEHPQTHEGKMKPKALTFRTWQVSEHTSSQPKRQLSIMGTM